jgi:hypothetical protein
MIAGISQIYKISVGVYFISEAQVTQPLLEMVN